MQKESPPTWRSAPYRRRSTACGGRASSTNGRIRRRSTRSSGTSDGSVPTILSSARSVTRSVPDKRLMVCGMSTELSAAIGAVNSSAPSAKPAVRRCTCGLVGVVPSGAVIGSRRSRNDDSRFGTAASRWANAVSGEPLSDVDEGLLHFRALVGGFGHARILLYGQAPHGRFGLFGQRFFVIGAVIDAGRTNTWPGSGCGRIGVAAHLHYVDCLQSSLVSLPVFPVL